MGRKKREKAIKRKGKKEEKQNEKNQNLETITSPEVKENDNKKPELKALDFINILTRRHLRDLLTEYEAISYKHNDALNLPVFFDSFQDLKREEISRLEILKKGFSDISKANKEESMPLRKGNRNINSSTFRKKNVILNPDNNINEEVMLDSQKNNKGKRNNLSTFRKKNVISSPDKIDSVKYQVDKKEMEALHRFNMKWFISVTSYELAGFNKYRLDQIPCVYEFGSIFEQCAPNRVLQETMLSLKMSEENKITEYVKEKTIRILAFVMQEDREWLRIHLTIPEIYKHCWNKIELRLMETFITFYADDFNGKDYVFEMYNLANKVVPKASYYEIHGEDSVVINVKKKKLGLWKQLFAIKSQIKPIWEKEMKKVLSNLISSAYELMESLEFIWKISLVLANCGTDFLNLPSDLNHVNANFESLEQMIFAYKLMITHNNWLKALIFILGGALLSKLMKSTSSNSKNLTNKKSLPETEEKKISQLINEVDLLYKRNYDKGKSLFHENKLEEAYSHFCKVINLLDIPPIRMMRGVCLFEMKRYKESLIDSIFALRNIGPFHGHQALIVLLQHKMINGHVITAIDQAISLEHNHNASDKNIEVVKELKESGLYYLKNIFKGYSLIFRKKFKDAIPFLENVESIDDIKSKKTSVILLLLYFVCKDYEKAMDLGKLILEDDTIYDNLVLYLLGMSSYYMKNLSKAIKYLEGVKLDELADLLRIKVIRDLVYKADDLIKNLDLDLDIDQNIGPYYNSVLNLSKDNKELQAHALNKLGVLNYMNKNYHKGIVQLTCSIDFVGKTKNVLLVRSLMYEKLGLIKEANEDRKAINEL